MPEVAGIRFKNCGRIYDFDSCGIELRRGERVIVESEFGLSIGTVVSEPRQVDNGREFKRVIRAATGEDVEKRKENETFEKDARAFCQERIMARGIPMRLVCTEATLDRKRVVFYFTADGRIDFRELVKDLAAKFRTRIEMRQIGVRDKAKLLGGLGVCGKELCCRVFLTSFEPISIKMAKQQDLSLNTSKLSGVCGRLMCCLGYEYNNGQPVAAPAGEEETAASAEEMSRGEELSGTEAEESLPPVFACCPAEGQELPVSSPREKEEGEGKQVPRRPRRRRRHRKKGPKNE